MPASRRLDSLITREKDINNYKGHLSCEQLEITESSSHSDVQTRPVASTYSDDKIIEWLKPCATPRQTTPTLKLLTFRTRNPRSAIANLPTRHAVDHESGTISDVERATQVKFILRLFDTLELPLAAIGSYIKSHTTFATVPGSHRDQVSRFYCSGTSWTIAWAYSHASRCTSAVMFHREGDGDERKADVLDELYELQHRIRHPLLLGYIKTKISLTFTFDLLDTMNRETLELETNVGLPVWDWNLDKEREGSGLRDNTIYCIGRSNVLSSKLINVSFRLRTYQEQIKFIIRHNAAFRQSAHNSGQAQLDCSELDEMLQGISDYTNIHLFDAETLAERLENQRTSIFQLNNLRDTEASLYVAMDSHKTNTSMFMLTVISSIFLPGTFIASIFDIPMFDWSTRTTNGIVVVPFVLFWCISGSLTFGIILCCYLFIRYVSNRKWTLGDLAGVQQLPDAGFNPRERLTTMRRRATSFNTIEMRRTDTARSGSFSSPRTRGKLP